jgi:hypothetical protein
MYGIGVPPFVIKAVAALLLLLSIFAAGWYIHHSGYQKGHKVAEDVGRAEMANYKEAQRKIIDKIVIEIRRQEEELAASILQGQTEKEVEIKAINDNHQRIVDGLRNRPTRRDRQPAKDPDPAAPTAQCTRADSTGSGLSKEDGEFLVGEAAGADTLRRALQQCRKAYQALVDQK